MVPAPLNVDSHQVQATSPWAGLEQVVPHLGNTDTVTATDIVTVSVTARVTVSTRGTAWGTATSRLQLQLQ